MNVAIQRVEKILTSAYSVQNYTDLIREIFPTVKIIAPDRFRKEYTNFSSHIEGSAHVGTYNDPEGNTVIIHSVQLKKETYVETSRSTQRSYAKKLMERGNADAAIIAFYTEGDPKWRISFVRLDHEIKFENGKMSTADNLTPAKRYSYLVGKDEPCHTAISRFHRFIIDDPNAAQPTLDDLEEAFSVEKVTEEFFNLYCEKFHQLREALEVNPDFVEEAEDHNFTSSQFAKKLMGQIVFLYFLQKKGWLGVGMWTGKLTKKQYDNVFYSYSGARKRLVQEYLPSVYIKTGEDEYQLKASVLDQIPDDAEELIANALPDQRGWGSGSKTFMRTLFNHAMKKGGNFFDEYLEPLFYNALNVNRGELGYDPDLHCRVPFLSGGLFEPIDGYDWKHNDFAIPNNIFSNREEKGERDADGILDIFDRYNFTMSEDEPLEREVAIDPEMLGKVFENLLEVNDRKSKGAFYTPREIVHYMCQETLISYLVRETGLAEPDIRDFILMGDFMKDEDTSKDKRQGNNGMFISENIYKIDEGGNVVVNRLKDIDDALANIRVADPAVGSGAFPLGMLNEIVRARQNISAYMAITMNAYETRMMYNNERSPYSLKVQTIKNCIFAADIEPSAVDIAQLRLWLSLVIDDEINPNAQSPLDGHRNPIPLPNLECNIVCGNSLIDEFEGTKLVNYSDILGNNAGQQQNLFQNTFEAILPSLLQAQDELFRCQDPAKKQEWKDTIDALKNELAKAQMQQTTPDQWERYQEAMKQASRPFVLWQIDFARVFREKGGFDVVIGNPPYVGESGHKEIFRPIAATNFGKKYYQGKMDFFYFFFHKGLDLLHIGGLCSLITTNYYLTAAGARTLRSDFARRANIWKMVNFNELRIFPSALGQHNIITFLEKGEQQDAACCITSRKGNVTPDILNRIVQWKDEDTAYFVVKPGSLYDVNGNIAFHEEDNILEKMNNKKNYTFGKKDVGGGIDILQESVVERHLSIDPSLVIGKGIFAVETDEIDDLGFTEKEKKILKPYYTSEQIGKYILRGENHKWILYTDKRVCENIDEYPNVKKHFDQFQKVITSDNKPYGLHRPRVEDQFKGTKLLSLRMTREPSFALAEKDTYVTRAYLTIKLNKLDYKYALGLFNSKLFYYWLFNMGKRKGKQLQVDQAQIMELPVYVPNKDQQDEIISKVELLQKKLQEGEDTNDIIGDIDNMVYKLYELTDSEIAVVNSFVEAQRRA